MEIELYSQLLALLTFILYLLSQPLHPHFHLDKYVLFQEVVKRAVKRMISTRVLMAVMVVALLVFYLLSGTGVECNAELKKISKLSEELIESRMICSELEGELAALKRKVATLQEDISDMNKQLNESKSAYRRCKNKFEELHMKSRNVKYLLGQCEKKLRGDGKLLSVRLSSPFLSLEGGIPNPLSFGNDDPLLLDWEDEEQYV